MTKRRAPEEKKKPGKKGWIHGSKFTFFDSRKNEWQAAVQAHKQGAFYTKVTRLYFLKYGDLELMEDLEEDIEDPEDEVLDLEDLSEEEAREKQEAFRQRRTAIGQWYRGQYASITKAADSPFARMLEGVNKSTFNRPRRPRIIQFYSTKYYKDRIKGAYEAEWERVRALPVPAGKKKPAAINVRNRVTREKWDAEDPELRKLVEQAAEDAHRKALEEYEAARTTPAAQTAQDYHQALAEAGQFLKPLADVLKQRFGLNVSIMMCGPIGALGGRIEVRSIHAGSTRTGDLTWPEADPMGYRKAEESMANFSLQVFSNDECLQRVLPTTANTSASATASSTTAAAATRRPAATAAATNASTSATALSAAAASTTAARRPAATAAAIARTSTAHSATGPSTAATAPQAAHSNSPAGPQASASAQAAAPSQSRLSQPAAAASAQHAVPSRALSQPPIGFGAPMQAERPIRAISELRDNRAIRASSQPLAAIVRPRQPSPATSQDAQGALAGEEQGGGGDDHQEQGDGQPGQDPPLGDDQGQEDGQGEEEGPKISSGWDQDMRKWPEELQKAWSAFQRGEQWGEQWEELVHSFLAFEKASKFPVEGPKRMEAGGRPLQVGKFIKEGRKWDRPGSLGDLNAFQEIWWAWWKHIQPKWRISGSGLLQRPDDSDKMDWGTLAHCSGKNGLLQVMMTLLWWGDSVDREKQMAMLDWHGAVEEVIWALDSIISHGIRPLKRKSSAKDKAPKPSKKARKDPPPQKSTRRASRRSQ